jgi:hypothetical protein
MNQSLQDVFVPVPIPGFAALQIFEELGSLVNEATQAPPARNSSFDLAEVVPVIAYFECEESD